VANSFPHDPTVDDADLSRQTLAVSIRPLVYGSYFVERQTLVPHRPRGSHAFSSEQAESGVESGMDSPQNKKVEGGCRDSVAMRVVLTSKKPHCGPIV